MPDLNDILSNVKSKKKETQATIPVVGGTFACQECYEEVDNATHDVKKEILKWICSEGHVSTVKFK